MSASPAPLTLEEFLERPDREDGQREELIEGELLLSPGPKALHAEVVSRLWEALAPLKQHGFKVATDFSVILPPRSMPWPDLAVVDKARWNEAVEKDTYLTGSPELVIEVRSPSNRRLEQKSAQAAGRGTKQERNSADLAATRESVVREFLKAALYLEHGAEEVWIVHPKRRTITVYDSEGSREVREHEPLDFHGVSIDLSQIFLK